MFEENFTFEKIQTPQILQEAFRLRFQVYCRECNFIKEADCPGGLETDEFDRHAVHFGGFDDEGRLIGAARLIMPSCGKFPIEQRCSALAIDGEILKRDRCAEISRLTITKQFRRRAKDGLYYEPQVTDRTPSQTGAYFVRRVRPMAFGLYKAIYHESKRLHLEHWFALMEKSLWMLLKIHGFVFRPIGPDVDFFGLVTPYIADIAEVEKSVYTKFPQFFDYFMENLEPELQPKF